MEYVIIIEKFSLSIEMHRLDELVNSIPHIMQNERIKEQLNHNKGNLIAQASEDSSSESETVSSQFSDLDNRACSMEHIVDLPGVFAVRSCSTRDECENQHVEINEGDESECYFTPEIAASPVTEQFYPTFSLSSFSSQIILQPNCSFTDTTISPANTETSCQNKSKNCHFSPLPGLFPGSSRSASRLPSVSALPNLVLPSDQCGQAMGTRIASSPQLDSLTADLNGLDSNHTLVDCPQATRITCGENHTPVLGHDSIDDLLADYHVVMRAAEDCHSHQIHRCHSAAETYGSLFEHLMAHSPNLGTSMLAQFTEVADKLEMFDTIKLNEMRRKELLHYLTNVLI